MTELETLSYGSFNYLFCVLFYVLIFWIKKLHDQVRGTIFSHKPPVYMAT